MYVYISTLDLHYNIDLDYRTIIGVLYKTSLKLRFIIFSLYIRYGDISQLIKCILYYLHRGSLNHMIAHQFPLNSSELPPGSPVYNEYISVLDKVLFYLRYTIHYTFVIM